MNSCVCWVTVADGMINADLVRAGAILEEHLYGIADSALTRVQVLLGAAGSSSTCILSRRASMRGSACQGAVVGSQPIKKASRYLGRGHLP